MRDNVLTENLGKRLTSSGHKVAVLAVDPSSGSTGGKKEVVMRYNDIIKHSQGAFWETRLVCLS